MDYLKAGSSGLSAASAEPEDVACDFCTGGRKRKASKSCLTCMTSYCKGHLDDHNSATPSKRHRLIKPTSKLQKGVCPRHNEKMDIFCRTDQQCICYLCLKDEHKGHDIVTVKAERDERVKDREHQDKILQRIKDREEDVTKLQQRVEAINVSADKAAEDSEKMLKELISHINKQTAEIKQKIGSQRKTEASRVKELQEKIQQQITELKKKITELEQLPSSSTENDVQFLRTYSLLSHLSEYTNVPSANNLAVHYFNEVTAAASKLRDTVQSLLGDFPKPPPSVTKVGELMSLAEPKTRDEFLKHACQITLDPNTMSTRLLLTKMNTKKASFCSIEQSYPSHPERFTESKQILSREGLTGRCYWEVKLSGTAEVAVAYKDIKRTGTKEECRFGLNDKSWSLQFSKDGCKFMHNNSSTPIVGPRPSKVGVYLDHSASTLSYYDVSESMALLHRVQTRFTQPLYPGFWLPCVGSTIELCEFK